MSENTAQRSRALPFRCLGIGLLIALGIALRAYELDSPPLWIDEAESTINALTILEEGVPINRYMGLPLYENTLIRPWPESEEYEFKDISYSEKGLAVYHSWLPLYSIAAALNLFGIQPDPPNEELVILHTAEDYRLRTIAPRIPSLVFSGLFLFLLYRTGREIYGEEVAWTALIGGAVLSRFVWFGRQARYYSATLCIATLCALAVWRAAGQGRWRDFLLLAVSLILLFHTHALSFLIACALVLAMVPFMLRTPLIVPKILSAVALSLLGTLPWVLATGVLGNALEIPKAFDYVSIPANLAALALKHKILVAPCLAVLAAFLAAILLGWRIPDRFAAPFRDRWRTFYFLGVWLAIASVTFNLVIPIASYFDRAVTLVAAAPGMLLSVTAIAALWRGFLPRFSTPLTAATLLIMLAASDRAFVAPPAQDRLNMEDWTAFDAFVRDWNLAPGTRIYCSPNNHFLLTYYFGLPVQSIAPIRKSYLENFQNDLVIIEKTKRYSSLSPERVRETAQAYGLPELSEEEVKRLQVETRSLAVRKDLQAEGAKVHPPTVEVSPFEQALVEAHKEDTRRKLALAWGAAPIFRGQEMANWAEWWQFFWYRFVDSESRRGKNLNYAGILPESRAWVLPSTWVIYEWDRDGVPLMDSFDSIYATIAPRITPG